MPRCKHCQALFRADGALYCRYCGKPHAQRGKRLLAGIYIRTAGESAEPLIPYGVSVPASFSDTFFTTVDNQEAVYVHLLIGNAPDAKERRTLLNVAHPIAKKGRRGSARVQLTMLVDENGKLSVYLEELGTDNRTEKEMMVPVTGDKEKG